MTNDIAPLTDVQERIKDKLKAEFVELMPDELWRGLVTSVTDDFIKDGQDHWGKPTEAPIKRMIREELEGYARSLIKAKLAETQPKWDGYGDRVVTDAVMTIVEDNFEDIAKAVNTGIIEMTVATALQHMRNSMNQF